MHDHPDRDEMAARWQHVDREYRRAHERHEAGVGFAIGLCLVFGLIMAGTAWALWG